MGSPVNTSGGGYGINSGPLPSMGGAPTTGPNAGYAYGGGPISMNQGGAGALPPIPGQPTTGMNFPATPINSIMGMPTAIPGGGATGALGSNSPIAPALGTK